MPLLRVEDLHVSFYTRRGVVRAVDGVAFAVEAGETLGIAGESGSGKSATCHALLRLLPEPPARYAGGKAWLGETDLLQCPPSELRRIRGRRIGIVFQDPMTSLNPYLRISEQLIEPLLLHERLDRRAALKRAEAALEEVGIPDAGRRLQGWPHEFSGGMRQRVMIAMALIARPDLLIADEPTTALDVTVQAQILDLIRRLQRERGMAVIFVTHDLGVVAGLCDRVQVMYGGRIVESGPTTAVFSAPQHPYTRALMRSIPALQAKGTELYSIPGKPPDLTQPIEGCPFAPRCEFAAAVCRVGRPALLEITSGHATACVRLLHGEIA